RTFGATQTPRSSARRWLQRLRSTLAALTLLHTSASSRARWFKVEIPPLSPSEVLSTQKFLPGSRHNPGLGVYLRPSFQKGTSTSPPVGEKNFVASVKHCSILAPFVLDSPSLRLRHKFKSVRKGDEK